MFSLILLLFCLSSLVFSTPTLLPDPVRVNLYVMATCPDAIFCEGLFDQVLKKVGPLAQLEVDFIGTFDQDGRIKCKRGDCDVAAKEVCLKKLSPHWFPLYLCLNANIKLVRKPETWTNCALKQGISLPPALDQCVQSGEGGELLRRSVLNSQAAGATKSCSIYFNGVKRCIHDGDWYDCTGGTTVDDFAADICKLSNHPNKDKYCKNSSILPLTLEV